MLIGKQSPSRSSGSAGFKAARSLLRKAFFCVDNVDKSSTTDDIVSFVTSLSVRVVSCFDAKPRRSYWQRQANIEPERKAYRLCINGEDRDKFLVAESWPADITISAWNFKAKDSTGQQSAVTQIAPLSAGGATALPARITVGTATVGPTHV
jgi:hypothetical protein